LLVVLIHKVHKGVSFTPREDPLPTNLRANRFHNGPHSYCLHLICNTERQTFHSEMVPVQDCHLLLSSSSKHVHQRTQFLASKNYRIRDISDLPRHPKNFFLGYVSYVTSISPFYPWNSWIYRVIFLSITRQSLSQREARFITVRLAGVAIGWRLTWRNFRMS
jgi:hypothetical protein